MQYDCCVVQEASDSHVLPVPLPQYIHGVVRVDPRSVWWILRLGIQESIQD